MRACAQKNPRQNQSAMQQIAQQFRNTMTPDQKARTAATEFLARAETRPGFPLMLLKFASMREVEVQTRLAGAIYLKNLIKKYWAVEDDGKDRISADDRAKLKGAIVNVMLATEPKIRKQLGSAIQLICASDFPQKWPQFLPGIISRLAAKDPATIYTILEVLESVTRRYRSVAKSQRLWEEIALVLKAFQKPLLGLVRFLCGLIPQKKEDAAALTAIFKCLDLICQLFYSLSSQTIPEFFEDNIDQFMGGFHMLVNFQSSLLNPRDEDEAGVLEKTQTGVCEIVRLYTDKYEEEFRNWTQRFVKSVWDMLTRTTDKGRYDQLVPQAIRFLTSVVEKEWHKDLFQSAAAFKTLAEKVIIPQLKLRRADVELFEDNGLEYVRRDMEGSDIDTRRRTTVDFVRGLCRHHEKKVTAILKTYVEALLKQYQSNPQQEWVRKDAAMYIVMALAVKGSTRAKGATIVNPMIQIGQFFSTQIIPELKGDPSQNPVLKADCLKFITSFRTQLPASAGATLIPIMARYLKHPQFVVHTYAAIGIERLLSVKDNNVHRLPRDQLKPFVAPLLDGFFSVFRQPDSDENEYAMRGVMRLCERGGPLLATLAGKVIQMITKILSQVAKNPRNPRFNHYLFETLACLIDNITKTNPKTMDAFEKALFKPFQQMLQMETCQEFGTYVFQILAQLLEKHTSLTGPFRSIFQALLHPAMWENRGNIPALIRLLVAYLRVDASIATEQRVKGLLGIMQKLVAGKREDHHGMALLSAIVEFVPANIWAKFGTAFMSFLLQRLMKSKTPKFTSNFVGFLAFFAHKIGVDALTKLIEGVKPGLSVKVIGQIIIPNLKLVSGSVERKSAAVGAADILCKSQVVMSNQAMWPTLLKAIVDLLVAPEGGYAGGQDTDSLTASDRAFKTAYAKLVFAPEKRLDPVADVNDAQVYLAKSLAAFSQRHPGVVGRIVGGSFEPKYKQAVGNLIKKAGVSIR